MSDVTRILSAIEQGDQKASEQLLPLVYEELRRLARHKMAQESPDHTLQATALVHEAYIRLVDSDQQQGWDNRGHFFTAAAEAMRRILVENARRKQSVKGGGGLNRVDLRDDDRKTGDADPDLLALDEALSQLQQTDPSAANLIKLRHFAGFTLPEAAEIMGVSLRTAERNWTYARTWLHRKIAQYDSVN